ncbi:MAG: hypothetical protein ACI3YC_03025 [Alloprevotella sp.]
MMIPLLSTNTPAQAANASLPTVQDTMMAAKDTLKPAQDAMVAAQDTMLTTIKDAVVTRSNSLPEGIDFLSCQFTPFWEFLTVFVVCFAVCFVLIGLLRLPDSHRNRYFKKSWKDILFKALIPTVLVAGTILYYIGYDYGGSHAFCLTVFLRALLSGMEMFLSKSNLIGIADNCKANPTYMFFFAVIHASAVFLTAVFTITCLARRLKNWFLSCKWGFNKTDAPTYVFWGLNERGFFLAKDIYKEKDGKCRIIFVDFPDTNDKPEQSGGLGGIFGFIANKRKQIKQLEGMRFLHLRTDIRPKEIGSKDADFFHTLNINSLRRILSHAEGREENGTCFFILSNDEASNLNLAVLFKEKGVCRVVHGEETVKVFCVARKNATTRVMEESFNKGNKKETGKEQNDKMALIIVDDSRMAVTSLKRCECPECVGDCNCSEQRITYPAPIDLVDIDRQTATVTSAFKALVVGAGTTGQEAMRYLYEFSAFPGAKGKKSPVEIHLVDNRLPEVRGVLHQEIPGLRELENKEIFFHTAHTGSVEFLDLLHRLIDGLNYVVVALGDDDLNLQVACSIFEYALKHRPGALDKFCIMVRTYQEEDKHKFRHTFKAYELGAQPCLYDFGSSHHIYKYHILIAPRLEEEAKEYLFAYENVLSKEEKREKPGENKDEMWKKRRKKEIKKCKEKYNNKEWGEFYGNRAARRKESQDKANAMHQTTKLKLLGAETWDGTQPLPSWEEVKEGVRKELPDERCVRLYNASICEHLRWNAAHLMMGYVPPTPAEIGAGFKGQDEQTARHACIVDWDKLNPGMKIYDYVVVKTTLQLKAEEAKDSDL